MDYSNTQISVPAEHSAVQRQSANIGGSVCAQSENEEFNQFIHVQQPDKQHSPDIHDQVPAKLCQLHLLVD